MTIKKVAVTGGAGFIGSHLVEALVKNGHRVLVVDNLKTGKREQVHPESEFIEMDVQAPDLGDRISRFRPDAVYHLAAQVSVFRSTENPLYDAQVNVMGTLNVLEACKASGAQKFIYASSAAVYGKPQVPRLSEEHPVRPLSFYGASKLSSETNAQLYSRLYGLNSTVLRYANVYGTRQDGEGEAGVVSIFAKKLHRSERAVIFGSGEQTRDFIYVQDVVQANLAALDRGSGSIMNVGSGRSTSVNSLLSVMCGLCGRPFDAEYAPARPGDIPDSLLDNRLALRELGWSPSYSLAEGLKETLAGYPSGS